MSNGVHITKLNTYLLTLFLHASIGYVLGTFHGLDKLQIVTTLTL